MNKFILFALVASVAFAAAGAGTIPPSQPAGREPKPAARSNVAAGAGTNSQTQPNGRDANIAARSNVESKMPPSKTNPTQQIQPNDQNEKSQSQTKSTSVKKEPVQTMTATSPAKTKEEEDSLRNFWSNKMDFEQQKNCSKFYDQHKSPVNYAISNSEWESLTKVERMAVIRSKWDDLRQKTKACVFHIYEEESKAAKEKKAEEAMKPKITPIKTNPAQPIQPNGQIEKSQSQTKSTSMKKEPVQPMASNSPAKNKEEENSLRIFWLQRMDLEQKTDCYQIYDDEKSPADYAISDSEWKSLNKVGRLDAIRSIWNDLRQKIKACVYHIYEEEAKAAKAKEAEEAMKKRMIQELKRNKLLGNNNKQGDAKKDVYGVATKEEAVRLRHHWYSLDLDEKTKCYEMYEHNEHPTRKEYMEWKTLDQTKRKEEVLNLWPTMEDDMKSCVIHIADEETKMGEKMLY